MRSHLTISSAMYLPNSSGVIVIATAPVRPFALHFGGADDLRDLGVEAVDDRRAAFLRRDEPEPDRRLVAGHAGLADGRNVGQHASSAPCRSCRARAPDPP